MYDKSMSVLLTQLPYFLCSLAAFGSAAFCTVMVRKRLRPRWWILGVGAYAALGVGFFLLAATSSTGGYFPRSAVATPIRYAYLVGGALWCALLILVARSAVYVERGQARARAGDDPPGCVGGFLLALMTRLLWDRRGD